MVTFEQILVSNLIGPNDLLAYIMKTLTQYKIFFQNQNLKSGKTTYCYMTGKSNLFLLICTHYPKRLWFQTKKYYIVNYRCLHSKTFTYSIKTVFCECVVLF